MKRSLKPVTALVALLSVTAGIVMWLWNTQSPALSNGLESDNTIKNRSEQVSDAFFRSDLVILGTVASIRNYTPTDGGHGYDIAVSEVLKGDQANMYSVRAGGWAYTIPLNYGDKVLLFLNQSDSLTQSERFVLALDHERKPLAFRIEADQLVGVAPPEWRSLLSGCSLEEIREILEQDQVP